MRVSSRSRTRTLGVRRGGGAGARGMGIGEVRDGGGVREEEGREVVVVKER